MNMYAQKGVVLFISLVLLLVLTIIGVSSVQTTSLEQRMARNSHDSVLAFQAAEVALRDAENYLQTVVDPVASFPVAGTGGYTQSAPYTATEYWDAPGLWTGSGSVVAPTAITGVDEPPRYIIEWVATVDTDNNPYLQSSSYTSAIDSVEIFRITARGVGGSTNARVILQSTFGVKF